MSCKFFENDLNALIDGELPRDRERVLLDHLASCPMCAADLAALLMVRSRLGGLVPESVAPVGLMRRMEVVTSDRSRVPVRRKWTERLLFGAGTLGLAAALVLAIIPKSEVPTLRAVVDADVRHTTPIASVGVAGTSAEAAKAWFIKNQLAQPPARDLTASGFAFQSFHADVVAGHRASVLVYANDQASISVVAWPANHEAAHDLQHATVGEQSVEYWNDGQTEFWVTGRQSSVVKRFVIAYRRLNP